MKLLLLADAANTHTINWATYLVGNGFDVEIISLLDARIDNVKVHILKSSAYAQRKNNLQYNRIKVLREVVPQIKRLIKVIQPDILHAHFLSSFGLFGALSGFHPFLVSVWGSDITDFPNRGVVNRSIVKFVLKKTDLICASSEYLVREISRFTDKKPELVFFGTDFAMFKPSDSSADSVLCDHFPMLDHILQRETPFIFGTVKGLYPYYGINYLLDAASLFNKEVSNWELWIGGDGISKKELQNQAERLGIADKVRFLGRVPYEKMPELLSGMNAFVVPSLRESFGVVAVEASACCLPLIVTATGGLPETMKEGETGFCVEPANPAQIAEKLLLIYNDEYLGKKMGNAGREYVQKRFCQIINGSKMIDIYRRYPDRKRS